MVHIKEEQISAYIDGQLGAEERAVLEVHLSVCERCRTVRDDFSDVSHLFRQAERFEPSPFLWNRIAADFDKEISPAHDWKTSLIAGLRKFSWNLRLASATLVVLVIAGVVAFHENNGRVTDRAALANIDRTYKSLAALDPDTYNPFGSSLPRDLDTNPFKSLRLSGEKPANHPQPRGNDQD